MHWPAWASQAAPQWPPQWIDSSKSGKTRALKLGGALLGLVLIVFLAVDSLRAPTSRWNGTFYPDRTLDKTGYHGAVASDVGLCSEMGVSVLKRGGSAADAAVVVALCIGSANAQSSGIGGGGFITVKPENGSAYTINARETAPKLAHKNMFNKDPQLSRVGGLASGVPGEVAGLYKLWELEGRLPWKELVDSVAELNEVGFERGEALTVTAELYRESMVKERPETWDKFYNLSDWDWAFADSRTPLIRRPNLARTLREIANGGAAAFYNPDGWIAQSIARITQQAGGILTAEDIAAYEVLVLPALNTTFRGRTVFVAPAPASGNALVMALNVLDSILPEDIDVDGDQDPVYAQYLIEAMKWMAAARSELGNPGFVSNPKIEEMLGDAWAARVVGNISADHTLPSWRDYHPSYEMNEPHGTSHFSVVDKDGAAVSMTTTVNLLFGNFVCDPETGIVMNSQMDDFSVPLTRNSFELAPSIYNFVKPGKRPLSSTVPSIILDENDRVELVVGAAGGSRILTSVFQAIVRQYAYDMDALETVAFPRMHHQLIPEVAELEVGWPKAARQELHSRGHAVKVVPALSAMSLIKRDEEGLLHAVSDFYRKRGLGAAY